MTGKRLKIRLLGEVGILRDGVEQPLPQSRQTRALLAYLALNPRRHRRDELCALIWDGPRDPRGALRWSLSKLRPLLGDGPRSALEADRDGLELECGRIEVDLVEIRRALRADPAAVDDIALQRFAEQLDAGYLGGLDDVGGPEYQLWLQSEREQSRRLHGRVLDELVARLPAEHEALTIARKRSALDPLHTPSNLQLLRLSLAVAGRSHAQQTFERARALYRKEQLDVDDLRVGWNQLCAAASEPSSIEVEDAPPPAPSDAAALIALPDKPSVAVLRFRDLGAHEHGDVLATGLAVDLSSRLAQLSHLFVIAHASASRFSQAQLPAREIGRRLGVRYLVAGTTQRQERRVRVTVTLVDADNDTDIWSEHFDRPLDDLFAVQDDITSAVISALEPAIERAEMERALLAPPESLSAWECYHRGLWHCFRFTAKDNELAHRMLKQAAELDPRFSRAHAGLSFTHYSRAFLNAAPDVEREIQQALELAQRAVDFDGRDSMGHWCLGRALFLSREHDQALVAIDRALATNPNYAQGHYARGFIGIHVGLDESSLSFLDRAQRLSPFDPLVFAMKSCRAISLANQGQFADAATWAVRATHEPNAHFHIHAIAAGCLELAGQSADAQARAAWVLQRHPGYSLEVFQRSFPHKDEAHRGRLLAALERAGIPRSTHG